MTFAKEMHGYRSIDQGGVCSERIGFCEGEGFVFGELLLEDFGVFVEAAVDVFEVVVDAVVLCLGMLVLCIEPVCCVFRVCLGVISWRRPCRWASH